MKSGGITAILLLALFLAPGLPGKAGQRNHYAPDGDTILLKKVAKKMVRDKIYYQTEDPGSNQYRNYQTFLKAGSTFDFLQIAMTNRNPLVRIYAFRAAATQMDELPPELIRKFRSDSTLVQVQAWDTIRKLPVSEIANGFLK